MCIFLFGVYKSFAQKRRYMEYKIRTEIGASSLLLYYSYSSTSREREKETKKEQKKIAV